MRALVLAAPALLLAAFVPSSAMASEAEEPFALDPPEVRDFLKKAAAEISGQNIYDCIQEITTDPEDLYRVMGSPTHDRFVTKYAKVFSSLSPKIKDQVVRVKSSPPGFGTVNPGGYNIIGVLPGVHLDRWVVMGGHYDTREATVGGAAIDNTSGICTVKEIARAAVKLDHSFNATLVFAWWDGEEWGLYGSTEFVADHSATKELLGLATDHPVEILSGQSFDIVGINYPAYNTWVTWGDPTQPFEYAQLNLRTAPAVEDKMNRLYPKLRERDDIEDLLQKFSSYQGLVQELAWKLYALPKPFLNVHDDQYGRSDHVPFIRAGWPGMRIQGSHDTQWPHYHQPTDTLPAAVTMAGGIDRLVGGFNTAADVGGVTSLYIAYTGGLGPYSNLTVEEQASTPAERNSQPQAKTPAPGLAAFMAGLGATAWALRRR